MKLPSFKTIKAVATGAVKAAAIVADTGIFAGVPVVSAVLEAASSVAEKIEERETTDDTLRQVHAMLHGIVPVIAQVGAASGDAAASLSLEGTLKAMQATVDEVNEQVNAYIDTWDGLKYVVAKDADEELQNCLQQLDRQLHLCSFAVAGENYVEILKTQGMLQELKLGTFGSEEHLVGIKESMATSEQVENMRREIGEKLDGLLTSKEKNDKRKRARSERNAALEDAEIPEGDLKLEDEPFAEGGFAKVYKALWANKVAVAVKVVNTKGLTKPKRDKLEKDFVKEIAVMKKVSWEGWGGAGWGGMGANIQCTQTLLLLFLLLLT